MASNKYKIASLAVVRYLDKLFQPSYTLFIASYPGSSPTEKRGESLEELITCPVTYYAWFYVWFY